MTQTKTPKCPKGKALFSATTPDGRTLTRTSARDYTHAVAVFHPAEPQWEDEQFVGDYRADFPVEIPEGYEVIHYDESKCGHPHSLARIGRRIEDSTPSWGLWSFHGSLALADKAGRSYGRKFQIVPAQVSADRRGE